MSFAGRPAFSRRDLLKAAGCTLSVPLFLQRAFAANTDPRRPPSLVMLMQTNGTNQKNFWPAPGSFDSPILHGLLADPALASRTTLIKGINYKPIKSPAGNEHDFGFHGVFSGFDSVTGAGGYFAGGISLDQRIANEVPFSNEKLRHIHCGVHAVNYGAKNAGRLSFAATGRQQHVPCELDIYRLYETVFGTSGNATASDPDRARRRLKQRKSVLDAVAQDLTGLQARLGKDERSKIDIHLTSLRDFEHRLTAALPTNLLCSSQQPSQFGVPAFGQGNEENAEELQRLFMEFIANTVGCDMAGVLSFQFGRGGEHFHYDWLKIPGMPPDAHDFVAHQDNGDPEIERINTEIKKWYTQMVADLCRRLAAFPQTDGTNALDNSLVVWGNEIATGTHGMNDLPIVLLGGARGRIKKTGYVVDAGAQPHHRLGCTVLNLMGVKAKGFGAIDDCGMIKGLEVAESSG
jgi:hypothetical protein